MRVPFLALLLSLGTILALQAQIQAQAADQESPVSIDRIRAGLKRPPPLQIAAPSGDRPTFRIEVRARPFVLQPTDEKAFDPTFGLPSVGELLMDGIENVRSAAVHYQTAARRASSSEGSGRRPCSVLCDPGVLNAAGWQVNPSRRTPAPTATALFMALSAARSA